jgi:hypothetical protein
MKKAILSSMVWLQQKVRILYRKVRPYQYYSFERVAVFYGIKKIDGIDWHKTMSESLMTTLEFDGEFPNPDTRLIDTYHRTLSTSYGLLFLKKGTKRLKYSSEVAE